MARDNSPDDDGFRFQWPDAAVEDGAVDPSPDSSSKVESDLFVTALWPDDDPEDDPDVATDRTPDPEPTPRSTPDPAPVTSSDPPTEDKPRTRLRVRLRRPPTGTA